MLPFKNKRKPSDEDPTQLKYGKNGMPLPPKFPKSVDELVGMHWDKYMESHIVNTNNRDDYDRYAKSETEKIKQNRDDLRKQYELELKAYTAQQEQISPENTKKTNNQKHNRSKKRHAKNHKKNKQIDNNKQTADSQPANDTATTNSQTSANDEAPVQVKPVTQKSKEKDNAPMILKTVDPSQQAALDDLIEKDIGISKTDFAKLYALRKTPVLFKVSVKKFINKYHITADKLDLSLFQNLTTAFGDIEEVKKDDAGNIKPKPASKR